MQYTAPGPFASPFTEDELAANPHLIPAAQSTTALREVRTAALEAAKAVMSDEALTDVGKRQAMTATALDHLPTLRAELEKVEQVQKGLMQKAQALVTDDAPSAPEAVHVAMAQAIGSKSAEERGRLLDQLATGKEPDLLEAVIRVHPIVTGFTAQTVDMLRRLKAEARVPAAQRDALTQQAQKVATTRAALLEQIAALESAADREALKAKGQATFCRRDMDDAEKSAYIARHGLDAFKALPA